MNQELRNKLRNVVTQCRKLLEDAISQELEGKYGIFARKERVTADPNASMAHLSDEEQVSRRDILDHFAHIEARGFKPKDALDQLVREIAFTHLNRLCAYKMMEAREVYVGGQKFREAVSRGVNSNGVKHYLAEHEDDERLFNTGHQDVAYRHFLDWLGAALSEEIGVLFSPNDPANRLYPRQKTLDDVLDLLNGGGIKAEDTELREAWPKIWSQDETIGWVYQYFTPKELRDQARKESQAPRNSYELAFRNQFFTPRYVVEFLTDNTLGRIWYEMRRGETRLKDQCRYLVRRPNEVFLVPGSSLLVPGDLANQGQITNNQEQLTQEALLKLPIHIPHRPKKDPRELKILDPACGSGHFLLYCFDLLLTIYEEAYADPDLGPALQQDYLTLDDLRRDVPRLILAHNLHGIDIDGRASQIAALALWLRCQRAYQDMGLKKDRPKITRSNVVCAEPMPGEARMLKEFVDQLEPRVLGQVVEVVFDKMKLAGEAGSLLKIEEEIRDAVAEARKQWDREMAPAMDRKGRPLLFAQAELDRLDGKPEQQSLFDLTDITDDQFFEQAESKVIEALRRYAEEAQNGKRFQRRLFTEDAVRGFAFVDLCQKRYDVVLMNPPFGLAQKHLSDLIKRSYPDTYVDLYASFVTRGLELAPNGMVGAITSRAFLMTKKLARWRTNELIKSMSVMFDLGSPVMDDAFVEACAFVVSRIASNSSIVAFDRRFSPQKDLPIFLSNHQSNKELRYCVAKQRLVSLPQAKMLYSLPVAIHQLLKSEDVFEPDIGTAREGMRTFDDFRFLRLRWEVSPFLIGRNAIWEPLSKGGEYAIYYSDIHLLVMWDQDGKELGEENRRVNGQTTQSRQASDYWRRPGGTYSKRSVKGFSVRALPADCIFGTKGPAVLSQSSVKPSCIIGGLNSRLIRFLVHIQANAFEFNTGIVKRLPWKNDERIFQLENATKQVIELCREAAAISEVNSCFIAPPIRETVRETENAAAEIRMAAERARIEMCSTWDGVIDAVFGVDSSSLSLDNEDDAEDHDEEEDHDDELATVSGINGAIVSYVIGCAIGRWDIRYISGDKAQPRLPDPFDPLPICQPGLLQDSHGLPLAMAPNGYPLKISVEGIFVDDLDHIDDIVKRVRDALDVIWKSQSDTIEIEACELLAVKELRDYFRKPGKGGFWDDHISRYSKSRRKAPIDWLLQSSKKNYAIWLYYHRLDKDLLFKALVNYVEPKIRLETTRLETLLSEKAAAGDSSKDAKRLAKDAERQDDFLSELRDFEDKLRRAATLHLEPDLNDGVVLNIAPLHELVPWKEAKKYWDELLAGKYEWSSIGKQLREKGLVA